MLTVNCKESGGTSYAVHINGDPKFSFGNGRSNGPSGTTIWAHLHICLFPFFESQWYITGFVLGGEEHTFKMVNIPYNNFSSLHLEFPNAGYHFDAGSTYQVWGEK